MVVDNVIIVLIDDDEDCVAVVVVVVRGCSFGGIDVQCINSHAM